MSATTGFRVQCTYCDDLGDFWPDMRTAQSAAVWHVYENHPRDWLRAIGDRPPRNPRPAPLTPADPRLN